MLEGSATFIRPPSLVPGQSAVPLGIGLQVDVKRPSYIDYARLDLLTDGATRSGLERRCRPAVATLSPVPARSAVTPWLHRLETQGLVEARWGESEAGRKRKYYALTPAGTAALANLKLQWGVVHGALDRL